MLKDATKNRPADTTTESLVQYQTSLRGQLLATFADPEYRPPLLPSVAIELMRLSRRTDVRVDDIVMVLEKDHVLTAEVLRLAQSAAFATKGDIRSILAAIQRIGFERAAELFLRASLESKIFRARGFGKNLEQLRRHSVATAEIGRLICRRTRKDDNYAYICGLLHDVGIAAAIIAATARSFPLSIEFEVLWAALSPIHPQLTIQLAALWDLPAEIRTILRHHHNFESEHRPDAIAATSVLAEHCANHLSCEFHELTSDPVVAKATQLLRLSPAEIGAIEAEATAILDKVLY